MKTFEAIVISGVHVFENVVLTADTMQAAIADLQLEPGERLVAIAETPNGNEAYFTQLYLLTEY